MTDTSAPAAAPAIEHAGNRFLVRVDGSQAHLSYRREGDVLVITHTVVPQTIGGRGIAGQLTRAAFEYAGAQAWSVRPVCPFAARWAGRHPEFAHMLG